MDVFMYLFATVCAYLIAGVNPAIILSKKIYHTDIRSLGSGNPGFTNFKRVFGNRYAWYVLLLDMLKAILAVAIFGWAFEHAFGMYQFGAAYTGLFAMLGHAYPIWYKFKGGKGFLVGAATIWFVDWRAGIVALVIMMLLLFTLRYMSLSVICAGVSCPITLWVVGVDHIGVLLLSTLSLLFMVWRHKENIVRLCNGTESKFSLKKVTTKEQKDCMKENRYVPTKFE